jgi:hypothetical protein
MCFILLIVKVVSEKTVRWKEGERRKRIRRRRRRREEGRKQLKFQVVLTLINIC